MAPGANIVGYGSGAVISILDAVGGFDYAIQNKHRFGAPIRVISNSWGSSGDFEPLDPVNLASYAAYRNDMVVLFAAGNDGPAADTHNPYAQAPWVISVAAGTKDPALTLADFSSRGPTPLPNPDGLHTPKVTAPGLMVPTAKIPDRYVYSSGTSIAAPIVAGSLAALMSVAPDATSEQLHAALTQTAVDIADPGPDDSSGYGRIDLAAAVEHLQPSAP